MTAPLIALNGLTKRYGSFTAVDDVTFEVPEESICGLLGPNGAGKTTTFKCLLGFVRPSAGAVSIQGAPVTPATFEELAYVPERASLYDNLTIVDHLTLYKRSYKHYDDTRAHELLALFSLDPKQKATAALSSYR